MWRTYYEFPGFSGRRKDENIWKTGKKGGWDRKRGIHVGQGNLVLCLQGKEA